MRKPPWKAENARIKRKLAERKEPPHVVHEVVQVPARTYVLTASQCFDSYEVAFLSDAIRAEMARDNITKKLAAQMANFAKMELNKSKDGVERWRGSVMVVEKEP
jgi:hypothetical protein